MPLSDPFESIVEAARHGAEWAWVRLVHDIEPALRAYVRRQSRGDVDDLVSETWLHVARGLHRFRGDERAFRSWVFMIAHHRVLDERRRLARSRALYVDAGELDALGSPSPSAESVVVGQVDTDELQRVLDKLPHAQREVVLLRFVAGFGVTEVADVVGKSPGAVSALLRRALARLDKILDNTRTFSP
ncbi:MAG: RNA polymerase sigma factor [Coriobacteriia bacterium]